MRKRYDAGRGAEAFQSALQFGEAGLTLSRGTVLLVDGGLGEDPATQDL